MTPARDAAEELAKALQGENHLGWDPYDALSSPLLRPLARTITLRRAAIQALRRLPVNLRPLLGIPRVEHAKALALATSAHACLSSLDDGPGHREAALALAERLAAKALPTETGVGWGYEFDVQTRWGYYRRGEPNAVVTTFAGHALLDSGAEELRPLVLQALEFAVSELLVARDGKQFFAYFRGSTVPIHNANVLLAGLVARSAESELLPHVKGPVAFTLQRQKREGQWPYGEGRGLGWVDGFHTAYVLQGLAHWEQATGDADARSALERGLDFYLERLLDPDGAARASDRRRYPVDAHAAGTALAALAELTRYDERCSAAAERVLAWTLENLRRPDGRFAFQRGRLFTNSLPYVRWSDAHMLLGLASQAAATTPTR